MEALVEKNPGLHRYLINVKLEKARPGFRFLYFIVVYSLGYWTLRLSQITPTLLEPSALGPVPKLCGELISVIRAMVRLAL